MCWRGAGYHGHILKINLVQTFQVIIAMIYDPVQVKGQIIYHISSHNLRYQEFMFKLIICLL